MRKAIYPGTFDPITNGHIDVIHRASNLFDSITVAVAKNASKQPMFDEEKRVQLIKENFEKSSNVEVIAFDGLIVDLADKLGAVALIRGLRVASDFEYEFQMAQMNRHLNDSIETVYLMPTEEHFFTSSNLIKQVFKFTDREKQLIPENVHQALVNYYKNS
ncbi:MAG: Phosphopantetheine adenylyltransferase [Puniceicoccaceae bacterium MED-G32]|jgi:pantetheine-phosphate adenylyltransferase|nr:MAG: Phosphopantetheine adenylyltransferase [Puniceicoccaceae bacterium MED-G32]|tara:strand:- start:2814 stop:3296 length:483 start_codon:yes stop_codon:yes gene_type:complete